MADYRQQLRQVSQEYDSGERNYLDLLLGQAAVGGGMIGDAVSALIPEPVEKAMAQGMMAVAESPVGQTIGKGMGYLKEEFPVASRRVGEALEASSLAFPMRTALDPKAAMHKLSANLPNKMDFDFDPNTGKYNTKFYLSTPEAEARAKQRNPDLFKKYPTQAVQFEKGVSRVQAISKGLALGLTNAIKQSTSPKGQAQWREKGVSKTLTDMPATGSPQELFGQPAYERILGSQYGDIKPLLKKLDDDFFTHEGVFNFQDFSKLTKHKGDDAGPFFRTIMSNWGIKPGDDFLMIVRQPKGTEGSGDLMSDVMFKSSTARKLPSVFAAETGFMDSSAFLNLYDLGKRGEGKMTSQQRKAIKTALDNNPEILAITDRAQFSNELAKAVSKTVGSQNTFGVGHFVNAAFKKKPKKQFKSNDELAQALEAQGLKVVRRKDQKDDPDVFITDSVSSSAYELGGVNIVYKVERNGDVTAQVSDVNDLVGVGAPGAKKMIVVTPPMKTNIINPPDRPKAESKGVVKEIYDEARAPVTPKAQDYISAGANIGTVAAPVTSGLLSGAQEEE